LPPTATRDGVNTVALARTTGEPQRIVWVEIEIVPAAATGE